MHNFELLFCWKTNPLLIPNFLTKDSAIFSQYVYTDFSDWSFLSVLWSDETIISLFGHNDKQYVRRPKGKALDPKYTTPSVKNSLQIAVWGCFSSKGPGELHLVQGNMDKYQYRDILQEHVKSSVRKLGMPRRFVFQQDNDPKVCICFWLYLK